MTKFHTWVLGCCGFVGIENFGSLSTTISVTNSANFYRYMHVHNDELPKIAGFVQIVLTDQQERSREFAVDLGFKCLNPRKGYHNTNSGNNLFIYVMDHATFRKKMYGEWEEEYQRLMALYDAKVKKQNIFAAS